MNTNIERITVLALVCYGYIILAAVLFTILFYITGYFLYKQYIKPDLESREQFLVNTADT